MSEPSMLWKAVADYESALNALGRRPDNQQILKALMARDTVQKELAKVESSITPEDYDAFKIQMLDLFQLDEQLKTNAEDAGWAKRVDGWRESLGCSKESWWWVSSNLHCPPKGHYLVALTIINFLILVPTVTLAIETSSRLLAMSWDFFGNAAIVLQSLLALIAGKISLTQSQEWLDHLVKVFRLRHNQQAIARVIVTLMIGLLVASTYYLYLPWYSHQLLQKGLEQYEKGAYIQAQKDLTDTIQLEPTNWEAQNKLGEIYETLDDAEKAEHFYHIAIQSEFPDGYINLSRLHNLEGLEQADNNHKKQLLYRAQQKLGKAKGLLEDQHKADPDHPNLKSEYDNLTHSGWAYLEQFQVEKQGMNNQLVSQLQLKTTQKLLHNAERDLRDALERWEIIRQSGDRNFSKVRMTIAECVMGSALELHINQLETELQQLQQQRKIDQQAMQQRQEALQETIRDKHDLWNTCFKGLEEKDRQGRLLTHEVEWLRQAKDNNSAE